MKEQLDLVRFNLRDGSQIRFWEHTCLGNKSISYRFANLFNILCKKHATIAEVFNTISLIVSFGRALIGSRLLE